jgi:hypothetical protein
MTTDVAALGVREAVGLFADQDSLQGAIDELLSSGFDRAELSLLASEHAVTDKLGYAIRRSELEDDPDAPRSVYVSPDAYGTAEGGLIGALAYVGGVAAAGAIALAGGPLTLIIVGGSLAGGAGGLVGSALAKLLGHHRAAEIREHVHRGGMLLWVRTWDAADEQRAVAVMRRHSGKDVHVHTTQAPAHPEAAPRASV